MKDVQLYIKRIIALAICSGIFLFFLQYFNWYFVLPPVLLAFSLVVIRINGELPNELFDYTKAEQYYNKGGLRELFRLLVMLFGFIYDIIIYIVWGAIDIFLVITDIILLFKIIIYWIIHAIIWFLKLYVPFWRLLYYNSIHYLVKWPWWIYRNCFKNIKYTYNRNVFRVGMIGSVIALFIFQVFYFMEIALDISMLRYVGIILALLPIAWVFGVIASLRAENELDIKWFSVQGHFNNGMESVRSLLFFIAFFVLLLIVQVGLNMLGWIPKAGITIASFSLNINMALSCLLIAMVVIIFFTVIILPSYRIFNVFDETSIANTWTFLKRSLANTPHYLSFFIPFSFFGAIASVIPIIIVALSVWLTLSVKDNVTQIRLNVLKEKVIATSDPIERYQLEKDRKDLVYIQKIPYDIEQDMRHRDNINTEIKLKEQKVEEVTLDYNQIIEEKQNDYQALEKQIEELKSKQFVDQNRVAVLEKQLEDKQKKIESVENIQQLTLAKLDVDLQYLSKHKKQIPLIFYFISLLIIVLGTFILTTFLGYMGNVLYDVYTFRNNKDLNYILKTIKNEQTIDAKQPLLSTTINIITIFGLIWFLFMSNLAMEFVSLFIG